MRVAARNHRRSVREPKADRYGNADRWRHYHVQPIDRSGRERAELPDDLFGPRQYGSRLRHWAAGLVQGPKRAQAQKPAREQDRAQECVHRQPPQGDRRRVTPHRAPYYPAQKQQCKSELIAL